MAENVFGVWDNQVVCRPIQTDEATGISKLAELREYAPGTPIYAVMGWDGHLMTRRISTLWIWRTPIWM